jgi:high-affinity iron transporter
MIESFVILLREGIEVALVVSILIVYLRKVNQPHLLPLVYLGLGLAVLASIAGAIMLQKLGLDNEALEGYFLLVAGVFVALMIIWMWRTARGIRREIEQKVDMIVKRVSSWQIRAGILVFTFSMVFREGIETAVFLGAVSFTQNSTQSFVGGLFGVVGAVAFGVLFVKGSIRIDVARFLKVTALVLLIFVAQLFVNAIHEFFEMGILPPRPAVMGIVGPIVRNDLLFILAILSIPAFMFMIPGKHRKLDNATGTSKIKRWQFAAGLITLSIVFFLGFNNVFSSKIPGTIEAAQSVILREGFVHIPVNEVDDGALHRYSLKQDSIDIRFLVLRTGLGSYATMFDACRPCYNYGKFYISGDNIVCSQCDAAYPVSELSRRNKRDSAGEVSLATSSSGDDPGCSPIHLQSRLENGEIVISAMDLQSKREYFELKKEEP